MGLLATQRLARAGIWIAGACSFLTLFCGGRGVVVGPLLSIYVLFRPKRADESAGTHLLRASIPTFCMMLGASIVTFLGAGGDAAEMIESPLIMSEYLVRAVVDVLISGNLGFAVRGPYPATVYLLGFAGFAYFLGWIIRHARSSAWNVLAVSAIGVELALMVLFRSWLMYWDFLPRSRYFLLSQFGVAILVAGGIAELRSGQCRSNNELTWRETGWFAVGVGLLVTVNLCRPAIVGG